MVLIFLLSLFSVAQFTLTDTLSTRDSAIDALNKQLGNLASVLSLEKAASDGLKQDLEKLTLQLRDNKAERDRLGADLAAQRSAADRAEKRARSSHRRSLQPAHRVGRAQDRA